MCLEKKGYRVLSKVCAPRSIGGYETLITDKRLHVSNYPFIYLAIHINLTQFSHQTRSISDTREFTQNRSIHAKNLRVLSKIQGMHSILILTNCSPPKSQRVTDRFSRSPFLGGRGGGGSKRWINKGGEGSRSDWGSRGNWS